MPAVKRPLRGSRAFYPRKRARRIYPRIKSWPSSNVVAPLGFAGYKAGMTHGLVTDANAKLRSRGQPAAKALTIIECPPLSVFGFRCYQKTYSGLKTIYDVFSEKLDKNLSRKISLKPNAKKLENIDESKVSNIHLLCNTRPPFKKTPEVFEIALSGDPKKQLEYAKNILGKELKVSEIFKQGDYVDIIAVSKGKGFQGPVKRFGIRVHGRKARQMQRHVGSLGPRHPSRILPTVPSAGQLGFASRTELNKRIIKIENGLKIKGGIIDYGNVENECILLEGSVPGPKKRLIRMRVPIRPLKSKYGADLRYLSLESKQGV